MMRISEAFTVVRGGGLTVIRCGRGPGPDWLATGAAGGVESSVYEKKGGSTSLGNCPSRFEGIEPAIATSVVRGLARGPVCKDNMPCQTKGASAASAGEGCVVSISIWYLFVCARGVVCVHFHDSMGGMHAHAQGHVEHAVVH